MRYRLLLDENVERELALRLEDASHDVEHVDDVRGLGKGSDDEDVAAYSLETDRVIVTYDGDFVVRIDETSHGGVLYFADESLATRDVAAVVDEVSTLYPQTEITGVVHAGSNWL